MRNRRQHMRNKNYAAIVTQIMPASRWQPNPVAKYVGLFPYARASYERTGLTSGTLAVYIMLRSRPSTFVKEVPMRKTRSVLDPKARALKQQGGLNPHPEKVADPLFVEHDFFDPKDLVQVKYEMLRRVRLEGRSLTESAAAFGFTRPLFYRAQSAFNENGLSGLLPRRRGPKGPHKLIDEVLDFIVALTKEDESLHARALAPLVEKRFGVSVHPRSIERALDRMKKKRRQ